MYLSSMIYTCLLLFSIIFATSSTSWFLIWLALEINTISFITLMFKEKNKLSSESCFKYFFVQSISSTILIFSSQYIFNFKHYAILITLALLLKLGAAPLHFWFITIMQSISWMNCFILSTLQKFIPLTLLIPNNYKFMNLFILTSAMMGSMGGLNQSNLKALLAFSSISHIGWMLSTLNLSSLMFLIYLFIYTMLIFPIMSILNKYSILSLKMMMSLPKQEQTFFFMLLLSLGGFPPLLGFFPKWMLISCLINFSFTISMILILSSILNLYFYIRIAYPILLSGASTMVDAPLMSKNNHFPSLVLSSSLLLLPMFPLLN